MNQNIIYYILPFAFLLIFAFIGLLIFSPKNAFFIILISRPILDNINSFRTSKIFLNLNVLQLIGISLPFLLFLMCLIKKGHFFKHRIANIYLVFLFLCIPALIISDNLITAISDWIQYSCFWFIFIFAVNFLNSKDDIHKTMLALFLSSLYPIIRLLIALVMNERVMFDGIERVLGGYFHASIIGCLFIFFLPSYIYFYNNKKIFRFPIILMMLIIATLVYMTFYRTAFLGFLAFFSTYMILKGNYIKLLLLAFGMLIAFFMIGFVQDRFQPIIGMSQFIPSLFDMNNNSHDYLLSGRFGLWRTVITTYLYKSNVLNLFFGFGYQNKTINIVSSLHNDALQILFTYGLSSLIAFSIFIFFSLKECVVLLNTTISKVVFSLIVAVIVMSMAHVTFGDVRNMLYLGTYLAFVTNLNQSNQYLEDSTSPLCQSENI
jgi:O-antigen ligase